MSYFFFYHIHFYNYREMIAREREKIAIISRSLAIEKNNSCSFRDSIDNSPGHSQYIFVMKLYVLSSAVNGLPRGSYWVISLYREYRTYQSQKSNWINANWMKSYPSRTQFHQGPNTHLTTLSINNQPWRTIEELVIRLKFQAFAGTYLD